MKRNRANISLFGRSAFHLFILFILFILSASSDKSAICA